MTERRHLALAPEPDGTAIPGGLDPELFHELELPDDLPGCDEDVTLYNAVTLRMEPARLVDFDAGDAIYRKGERVIYEAPPGVASATVAIASRRILAKGRLLRVLRRVTEGDVASEAELRAREQAMWRTAYRVAEEAGLPVKIVRAEAMQGGQRFALYFTSEDKIPFRDLLRHLTQAIHERFELRQIGQRDAAKVIGGIGPCGLQLCCNTFLSDFAPVSMKMAKDQGLAQNPQRLSGVCGRLLCCLVYEEAYYRAQRKLVPRPGEQVTTKQGNGRVRDVDVLEMQVRVVLDSGELLTFEAADVQPLHPRRPDEPEDDASSRR